MSICDDPKFTGSCSDYRGEELAFIKVQVHIRLQRVDNYIGGKWVNAHYDWTVLFQEKCIASFNYATPNRLRTRASAVRAAKKAANEWATSCVEL